MIHKRQQSRAAFTNHAEMDAELKALQATQKWLEENVHEPLPSGLPD